MKRVPGGVSLVSGGAGPGHDLPAPGSLNPGVVEHGVRPSLRGWSETQRHVVQSSNVKSLFNFTQQKT